MSKTTREEDQKIANLIAAPVLAYLKETDATGHYQARLKHEREYYSGKHDRIITISQSNGRFLSNWFPKKIVQIRCRSYKSAGFYEYKPVTSDTHKISQEKLDALITQRNIVDILSEKHEI